MNQEIIVLTWICTVIMLIGMLILFIMKKKYNDVSNVFYGLSFLILTISIILYMFAATNFHIYINDDPLYLNRYLDWILTTPFLLIIVCLIGMYYESRNEKLILRVVTINIVMILCGLVSDLSIGINQYIWLAIGLISFCIILYLIWGPIENIASTQGCDVYRLYKLLAVYITVVWIGSSILRASSPELLGLLNYKTYFYLILIFPTIYKLGFIFLTLKGLKTIAKNNIN
ncbi:MAG: bacteriorhodopsin [Peptostreptococcaceae bacterium]